MGDTWITNMQDFVGIFDPAADVPQPARRLAEHLGRIVQAGTAWYEDQPLDSLVRCRRRPNRRACPGTIRLVRTKNDGIHWGCAHCDDNGVIEGWEGTPWDLSEPERAAEFVAVIEREMYEAAFKITDLPRPALRVMASAAVERDGVLLTGTLDQLDVLAYAVLGALRRTRGRRRSLLSRFLTKLHEARAEPEDETDALGPAEKMSETLLNFAAPLLDVLGPEIPAPVLKNVLTLATTVWNALTMEAWGRGDDYLRQARQQIATGLPQFMPMLEMLVERKRRVFGDDLRAIGEFEVNRKPDGELYVTADAYLPEAPQTVH